MRYSAAVADPNDNDKPPAQSTPSLEVRIAPAGRDTLAEIVGELAPAEPSVREASSAEPTVTVGETFVERETMAAIHAELLSGTATPRHPAPAPAPVPRPASAVPVVPRPTPAPSAAATELFELVTFVVRGADVSRLASERARREFVGRTLLRRLPVASIDEVERIDASPWTEQQSVVLRVLCRISADGG